jgi:hypothetical protein
LGGILTLGIGDALDGSHSFRFHGWGRSDGFRLLSVYGSVLVDACIHHSRGRYAPSIIAYHEGKLNQKAPPHDKQAFNGPQGFKIVVFVILSWLLEAVVLLGVSATSGLGLSGLEAIWVNSVTIAGQVFHFTPGGIGNYESIMSFSLVGLGFSWQQAYTVALISHGYKFVFAYLVGIYVVLRHPLHWDDLLKWTRGRSDPGQ